MPLPRTLAGSLIGAAWLMGASPAKAQEIEIDPVTYARFRQQMLEEERVARERGDGVTKEEVKEVAVRAKRPARSASDWEIDQEEVQSTRRRDGADVLGLAPGVFVSERGLLGRAPRLSLRGFDGTAGQDMEIFVGHVPINQVSNLRAPGYADTRLVIPEAVRGVRINHGPYDPRQGDFALAGSTHLDLGLAEPGLFAKGTLGSFGARRAMLAFAPEDETFRDSFAAFESFSIDGPGDARNGERTAFLGQIANSGSHVSFRALAGLGATRFDFPGYLRLDDIRAGSYPYRAGGPIGRDHTSQGLIGMQMEWRMDNGSFVLDLYALHTKTTFHQNLTGYVRDLAAGVTPITSDDTEQRNAASTFGLNTAYRRQVKLLSERDLVELGVSARLDGVEQNVNRLHEDGRENGKLVDATVDATQVGAYVDAAVHPIRRVLVRGGTRVDSLSFTTRDRASSSPLERTAQGAHLGNKAVVDVATGKGAHLVASYGEGFRSPQARLLAEGERVPFTTVRSVEAGARWKYRTTFQASLAGFRSWLSEDRVFDALDQRSVAAPPSTRTGAAIAAATRLDWFGASASATYARALFSETRGSLRAGDEVPYAPQLVLRSDVHARAKLGTIGEEPIVGRVGMGVEGAGGRPLPGGATGANVVLVDARAAVGWREFEVSVDGLNILDYRVFDSEYSYVSNFERSPTLPAPRRHVLVTPPASVFVTLQIHLARPDSKRGLAER